MPKAPLPSDTGAKVTAIIVKAIADIEALGADRANACGLLAIQSIIRIDGEQAEGLHALMSIRNEAVLHIDDCLSSDGETIN